MHEYRITGPDAWLDSSIEEPIATCKSKHDQVEDCVAQELHIEEQVIFAGSNLAQKDQVAASSFATVSELQDVEG